jgi:nucleoside-diphosphate-sugar epimerase
MKVLVLGGSGYIGSRLCAMLRDQSWAVPVSGSSRRQLAGVENVRLDARDADSLSRALQDIDAVVNCVAGDARSIAEGARALAQACIAAGCRRIVHLSSMSVYGRLEGVVREEAPLDPALGWYAQAKCQAESHMAALARSGASVVVLRPGCVWGAGSQLWVGRIARFLRAGRLGDLGVAGDGWSNLVHVDDVCNAVLAALRLEQPGGEIRTYHLAAPDSPRWNEYFVDLALAIGATPVRRISPTQLRLDAYLAGPPLKIAQALLARAGIERPMLPDPLPPGLLGLWERHLRLDCTAAQSELRLAWTPYPDALRQSTGWFLAGESTAARAAVTETALPTDLPTH